MASPNPFAIEVFDKSFVSKGTIGAQVSLTIVLKHNDLSIATLVMPSTVEGANGEPMTHPRLNDLLTEGARAVINYQGAFLMSGVVSLVGADGPRNSKLFTFTILDDWDLLGRILSWPVPAVTVPASGAAITGQAASAYDTRTGAAETVFKAFVTANKAHSYPSLTVAASAGRGASITIANRFLPLTDRLMEAVDAAGVGTTVRQVGSGLVVDCYGLTVYTDPLTEASGVIQASSYTKGRPAATRVVVAGSGDGTAVPFTLVVDAAREAAYGYSIERYLEAPEALTDAARAVVGTQYLLDNGPTTGLAVVLSETSLFRYDQTGAHGFRIGDQLPVEIAEGIIVTDTLRECTLAWTAGQGLLVTPTIGERSNDPARTLGSIIRAAFTRLGNIRR